MNRERLIDNLVVSCDRQELVTLVLRPHAHELAGTIVTGRILAVARHYTSRRALQAVMQREGEVALVVGLSMIRDFYVGPRRPDSVTERQIHESHDPAGGSQQVCRRCCKCISFEGATYRVTRAGWEPCAPAKVELRA